jgi:hypothetical protein
MYTGRIRRYSAVRSALPLFGGVLLAPLTFVSPNPTRRRRSLHWCRRFRGRVLTCGNTVPPPLVKQLV